jgi:hypothetical protein
MNKSEFIRLCNEFRISPTTDFRTKSGDNNGLGTVYLSGYASHGNGYIEQRKHYALPDKHYTFAASIHIAKIQRIVQNDDGWKYFITPKEKLTPAGIVRLNDSIITYAYCILGAQAEARSAIIIGSFGTELDAQKEFLKLLEDSIKQHVDIPTSIAIYQKSITDTRVKLDYIIAPGLYIIGSDMILKVGSIENYNNNILIPTDNMKPGKNNINDKKNKTPALMQGSPVKTRRTKVETLAVVKPKPDKGETPEIVKPETENNNIGQHEDIKFYLFILTGGLVSLALYFR